ncbi:MAG: ATPase [Eubacterium sp.]|nr:ATPase [Eubacterium sp.]
MSSKIDQIIEEIEDYIESCKFQPLSSTKIIVNKEEIMELIAELRQRTPEEVKRYQKMISNKEAILADAHAKADTIISQAQFQKNELVKEHEIMQQAYAQANEVVSIAQKQAQEIMDQATNDANEIRLGSIAYADSLLNSIEELLNGSQSIFKTNFAQLSANMERMLEIVAANRAELAPSEIFQEAAPSPQMEEPPQAPEEMEAPPEPEQ